eukprot:7429130-Heterocapsa_arctica.AAC.1
MKKLGYERCVSDQKLFYNKKAHALLSAHVDDMMLAAPTATIDKLTKAIDSAFKVKWAGLIDVDHWERDLGREWRRTATGFKVRIPKEYYVTLLNLFGLRNARPLLTPFPGGHGTGARWHQGDDEDDDEPLSQDKVSLYHTAVGKLMWLLQERPDLSYAIKEMSRAVQNP